MSYCSNCGSEMKEDDVFCTNCGAKQIQSNFQDRINFNDELHNSNSYLKSNIDLSNIRDILLNMLIKPVSGAKQFVEKTEKGSVILITVILALVQGVLGVWKVNQVLSNLQDTVINIVKQIMNIMAFVEPESSLSANDILSFTNEINRVKSLINVPYGKIFIQNMVSLSIIIAIVFVIVYLATNILSKNKNEAFLIYKTALIVIVPALYFEVFSILFSYISFSVGIIVALIGVISSLGTLTVITAENLKLNENYSVFVTSITCIAAAIGIVLCLKSYLVSDVEAVIMSITNAIQSL